MAQWCFRAWQRGACFLAAGLCVAAAAPASTEPGVRYVNERFGFSADIPEGFVADDPPDNGDGQAYHSATGHAFLSVSAIGNAAEESLGTFMDDAKADCLRDPPEYFVLRTNWAVLSCCTKDGILYTKTFMRGQGMDAVFTTARMTYPVGERSRWDAVAVAAAVANGLRPASAGRELIVAERPPPVSGPTSL